jgi:hypothetical protein
MILPMSSSQTAGVTGVSHGCPAAAIPFCSILVLLLPRLGWTLMLLFYTSCYSWDDRCAPTHQIFSVEMVSNHLFCPCGPGTTILPNSASLVAWDQDIMPSYWLRWGSH